MSARAVVLRSLVEDIAVPDARALCGAQVELTAQLERLARTPDPTTLQAARASWKRAQLAWERVYAFRTGPVVESRALIRATFWPVRTEALDQLQHGTVSDVDALGTDVRGMFALEWLLFGTAADALGDAAQSGDQSRRFALALAHNVEHYAALARDQLGDGSTLIARLQREPERGIGRFTQLSASSIEVLVHDRLEPLLQRGRRRPQLRGAVSGMSGALVGAQLAATERLYLGTTEPGHGLSLLVREAAPEIDLHLRAMFHTARVSVQTLGAPLSEVAIGEPQHIYAAHAALKELEKALKSELASALSMTLTFDAVDGD